MTSLGVETTYQSIRFRSRAEARWAALFDAMRWRWSYEPLDLEGYIPDFVLAFDRPLLVEVKGGALKAADLESHKAKIEATSWPGEALLVGAQPLIAAVAPDRWSDPVTILGLLAERHADAWDWAEAPLFRCLCCGQISLRSEAGSWRCRVSGCYDGNSYVGSLYDTDVADMWAEAQNTTRWK